MFLDRGRLFPLKVPLRPVFLFLGPGLVLLPPLLLLLLLPTPSQIPILLILSPTLLLTRLLTPRRLFRILPPPIPSLRLRQIQTMMFPLRALLPRISLRNLPLSRRRHHHPRQRKRRNPRSHQLSHLQSRGLSMYPPPENHGPRDQGPCRVRYRTIGERSSYYCAYRNPSEYRAGHYESLSNLTY